MKIICKDNYGRNNKSDQIVAVNIQKPYEAKKMCHALNTAGSVHSDDFFEVVPDDHKLYTFEP